MPDSIHPKLATLLTIGLCQSLRKGCITIDEAEWMLFSPRVMMHEAIRDDPIKKAIHLGTELEDVAQIVPDKLAMAIDEIEQIALERLAEFDDLRDTETNHWIDALEKQ